MLRTDLPDWTRRRTSSIERHESDDGSEKIVEVIYSLIPGMMFFGLLFLIVLIWALRSGQFQDFEGDGQRILHDDEEGIAPPSASRHTETKE
jgi:cbb3-type cytochrome oxidase maturation protein